MVEMIEKMVEMEQQMDKMERNLMNQMTERVAQMEKKMAQMEERNAQMEERNAQMEERVNKLEDKMTISIQVNEKLAQIVDVQDMNMQTLSSILNKFLNKAEQIVLDQPTVKSEEPNEKCRICCLNDVNGNVVCADCWKHCEPAKQPGLEAIEQELYNLKTEDEERFWRFHDKFTEQLGEYSQDTMHLFDSNAKEIRKLAEKHEKSTEDIRFYIDKMNYLRSSVDHMDDKVGRIIDVINYLTERIAGKGVADTNYNFMKFNYVDTVKGGRMTVDDLV